uniref:ELMO/CED-12 domain containing 2 n=1 Tax=Astyanax mexicanus TaxID=7994 RepID=W5KDP8_ASTMX
MLGCIWQYFYSSFLRFWLKWFLRHITGKCELQRICAGYKQGALRTSQIGKNCNKIIILTLLRFEEDVVDCVAQIMRHKNISEQKDPMFKVNLQQCLLQISGYNTLFAAVEDLRKEVFDSENEDHEKICGDLLMPSEKLESRITKQWGNIGFQGDDPKTDFRGMGMLGLVNLNNCGCAFQCRYSYAIVGINLTEMAYSLLRSGALKTHFYNTVAGKPEMQNFHQLYCYLAYEFNKFWVDEEPESIMEFNTYREKFHDKVKVYLQEPEVALILKLDAKN